MWTESTPAVECHLVDTQDVSKSSGSDSSTMEVPPTPQAVPRKGSLPLQIEEGLSPSLCSHHLARELMERMEVGKTNP